MKNNFYEIYAGILLVFIFPICFGIALGWRWGLFAMPFFHFIFVFLAYQTNGSNTKTNN